MTDTFAVQAKTGLSPEWDRGFDDEFADLISSDPDLVQAEFDALIGACFDEPPAPPPPPDRPVPSAARPSPSPSPSPSPEAAPEGSGSASVDGHGPGDATDNQRSPP